VPSVAPPGKHMLDTFQVMHGDNLVEERALALADLRDIFGADALSQCRIVRTSAFRNRWPVNQARQGFDLREQEPLPGLIMVGDAYKPSGHMMAEGVAAGVRNVAPRLAEAYAQPSRSGQTSQRGRRALQISRPRRMTWTWNA